ncbi:MAG: aquaporin [Mycoplasmataceae bacterium]|nr:aquaporin [Mycoplasmataceae bacterium]
MSPKSLKHCCVDEFFGTYLLIFMTLVLSWAFKVTNLFHSDNTNEIVYWTEFSLTFGSCYVFLFVLILFFGHGGALFNPALVLAMWTNKGFKAKQSVCYLLVELVGTILAGLTVYVIAGSYDHTQWANPTTLGITTINQHIWVDKINIDGVNQAGIASMLLGFMIEFGFFALFTLAIFQLAKRRYNQKNKRSELQCCMINSVLITLFLVVIVTVQIPLTGASCNPFRSLAPLVFQSWGENAALGWIQYPLYLLSTIIGAQLGVLCSVQLSKKKIAAPV